jgi:hypothetical protein
MRVAWIAAVLALGLGGCGSGGDGERRPPPSDPTRDEVAVIQGWADALRAGHVAEASDFFAVPALVSNPAPLLRLPSRAAVEDFNRGLPCGAELVGTERGAHALVIATFRLTERPGRGSCGTGTGALARTAFLIRGRRIVQWLRVADPPPTDTDAI